MMTEEERHDIQFEIYDKKVLRECYTLNGCEISKVDLENYFIDLYRKDEWDYKASRKVYFKDGCLKRQNLGLDFETLSVSYYNQHGDKCFFQNVDKLSYYYWDENGYIIGILDLFPEENSFDYFEIIDGKWINCKGDEKDILGNNLFIMKEVEI